MKNLAKIANNTKLVTYLSILAIIALGSYFSLAFRGLDMKTLLDTTFNFSATHLHSVLSGYGATLRGHYLVAEMIDLVVMIFVCFVQSLIIFKAFHRMRWGKQLHLIPLIAAVLNGLKDIAMVAILTQFPKESVGLANVTNALNIAKTIFVDASFGLILVAVAILVVRRIRK